jgi:multicomponent Na+:H+ antiporter subunit G
VADLVIEVLAVVGALLVVLAGVGVVRFSDVYARMHAATKAPTLGITLVGLAAALALGEGRSKIALAVAFIFVTAPSAAHLVGRSAHRAEGVEIDIDARDDLGAWLDGSSDRSS